MKKLTYIFLGLFIIMSTQMNAQKIDRSKMPKPGPAPKVNLGKPQTFNLPNGLKVMVVEDKKLPRFSINLTIDNEPYAEGDKKGVSMMTSTMLGKGSTKTPKDKFEDEVDFMGADIEIFGSGAYASGLSRYFDRILELTAEAALMPNFTSEELEKERERAIEGLKSQEKSAAAIADRVTSVLAYGRNHPFGEYDTEDAIKGITLEDVKNHYNKFFVPGNAYMVVIGDVDFEDVKQKVTKHFELWKKATAPAVSYSDPSNVQFTQINFVDVPSAVQAEVRLVNTTRLKMTDPDYFAVLLANEIVGGSFESYLNKTLREEKAWTYGARTSMPASKNVTRFRFSSSLKQAAIDSAVVEVLSQINKIKDNFVTDEELKNAKATFAGDFIRESSKPRTISSYALRIQTQDLPDNFYENYLANLQKVTKEDIKRVANKYFLTNNARIIVAAKGSEAIDKLESTGIPVFYFDKFGEKTEKPKAKEVASDVSVKSILEGYLKAIGGKEKAGSINSLSINGSAKHPQAPADIILSLKSMNGKKSEKMSLMGQTMLDFLVNDGSFFVAQGQKLPFEDDSNLALSSTSNPIPELSLLNNTNATLGGVESIDGNDCYTIKIGSKQLFYDTKTGLKTGESVVLSIMGQPLEISETYKDYKEVNGIKIPHVIVKDLGAMGGSLEFNVTEIKINEGVSDADFE